MKQIILIAACVCLSMVTSLLTDSRVSPDTINTLFTVSGIMFSVGSGLLVTYNASNVRNEFYRKVIRCETSVLLRKFIVLLCVLALAFIFINPDKQISLFGVMNWNLSHLHVCLNVYAIVYYITNMMEFQRLTREIDDKVEKSRMHEEDI